MPKHLAGIVLLLAALFAAAALASPSDELAADLELAKAKAAADKYQVEEAVALYTKAIDSGRLSKRQLAAAYTGRGDARENYTIAYGIRDSEMLLALRDFQKARDVAPTVEALRAEARALIALGGYAEANEVYRKARTLEPRPHWSLIGFARVDRIQQHYDAAIKHLDEAVRLWGNEGTMPIYYHRARIFYFQEEFDLAAEAVTNGIPFQPDYFAAYFLRACAFAHLGKLANATEDAATATKLRNELTVDAAWEKTPHAKASRQEDETNVAVIKAMAAGTAREGDKAKLCKDIWNFGEDLRTRSPLLGTGAT